MMPLTQHVFCFLCAHYFGPFAHEHRDACSYCGRGGGGGGGRGEGDRGTEEEGVEG